MDWAYSAGLLRLAGTSIQFRHRELQDHLRISSGPHALEANGQRRPDEGGNNGRNRRERRNALAREGSIAHDNRGFSLAELGRHEEAVHAYDQALAQAPADADAHNNQGIALVVTGDLDGALDEFNAADRLDPAGSGEGRTWAGAILWHRRDNAARDRFANVVGKVTGCTPFHTAEIEAIALCGLGLPDTAHQHLLAALPQRVARDKDEPRTIYNLLADPPLPGIEQLREIIDNGNI